MSRVSMRCWCLALVIHVRGLRRARFVEGGRVGDAVEVVVDLAACQACRVTLKVRLVRFVRIAPTIEPLVADDSTAVEAPGQRTDGVAGAVAVGHARHSNAICPMEAVGDAGNGR